MLKLLDFFFIIFHTTLVFFNLFGWIFKQMRFLNLITLLLTGGSWFILGIFYGLGYCPLTDWHFSVLEKMGQRNLPVSYIEYMVERLLPVNVNPRTVDICTVVLFFAALITSIVLNIGDHAKRSRSSLMNDFPGSSNLQ
ncbi:MAG: DUF2784 domain-containing protein [Bacteroidales bacterium]|nr:DUF2784 domain-containing protein [Bacteroidales bacterium]